MATIEKTLHNAEVGDGATIRGWTDCQAATIIARTAKTITVQKDKQTLLNGANSGEPDALTCYPGGFMAHVEGKQRYAYKTTKYGAVATFSLRRNGRWVQVGQGARTGTSLGLGRHGFYDFNF